MFIRAVCNSLSFPKSLLTSQQLSSRDSVLISHFVAGKNKTNTIGYREVMQSVTDTSLTPLLLLFISFSILQAIVGVRLSRRLPLIEQ